ncbi:MAG: hypothetical protein KJ077_47760 [Anaerolineae bacterium]|nr:hypothetical protein [Anaerolineae bacterium]
MNEIAANIWQTQEILLSRLLAWSRLSLIAGLSLLRSNAFWRGVGLQAFGWGLIDAAIALLGRWSMYRRRAALPDPAAPAVLAQESRNLRRLLWFNAGLDVLYVLGGLMLVRTRGATDRGWRGHGWGIVIQGGFLFLFDLYHALLLAEEEQA